MIGVIDCGIGNIGSILNMLKKVGAQGRAVEQGEEMDECDKLILPGVGAFDTGMALLSRQGRREALNRAHEQEKPILGICLGMQLLGNRSEEGAAEGLGYLPFSLRRFCEERHPALKVPHMGWDEVRILQGDSALTGDMEAAPRFYFVHSYYAVCDDPDDILMTCEYGETFAAAVHRNHVWGVQFHPEKSHRFGMSIMRNFAKEC